MTLENTVKKAGRNLLFKAGLYTSMLATACSSGSSGKNEPPVEPCASITQEELDDSNVCTEDYCAEGVVKHDAQAYSTQRNCPDPQNYCAGTDRVTTSESVTDVCSGVNLERGDCE